jgi:hypothetical protein
MEKQIEELQENIQHTQELSSQAISEMPPDHFTFIPHVPTPEHYEAAAVSEQTSAEYSSSASRGNGMRNKRLMFAGSAIITILGLCIIGYHLVANHSTGKTLDTSYKATQENPSALMWDGLTFWSADWYAKKIFKHKPHSLTEFAQTLQLENIIPSAMTWGDGYLWVADAWSKMIYQLSLDDQVRIEAKYPTPGNYASGLAWDGSRLWSCDADSKKIYVHDTADNLNVIKNYSSAGGSPSGLLWDGDALWSCDSSTGMIYRHYQDAKLSVAASYLPRDYQDGDDRLIGLTWDGKYFWTVGEKSGKFFRHSIHDMIRK